ncbi:MAG: GCN5-related N-acetyltransferase [Hyphomicrobiales bacterium]|nr:GCN5-related N-acetyltransferase [Hyphomicrobiales bacterium]
MTLIDVERIAAAAEAADGAAPLDEATWLELRHHPDRVRSWTRDDAFALLVGPDLSVVVHPLVRRQGLGGTLLDEALAEASGVVRAWSHGDHPGAARLAATRGFERVRELWVMRRPATLPLAEVTPREGVTVRGFEAGDEAELVRVNAAAFAAHPEQGAMDAANLAERMAQPWFDPTGLIVAMAGDRMLGFHWTKQHSPSLGEVYVVGIDPASQGGGLGKLLTLAGLHHLASRGVDEVVLYVESDNAPAIAVYRGLGFTHMDADTHVMYRR